MTVQQKAVSCHGQKTLSIRHASDDPRSVFGTWMIVINFEYYLQSTWLWLKLLGVLLLDHLPLSVRALCRGGQPGR